MSTDREPRKSAESSTPEPIGARIRRLREERRLSQDRLAVEAHVDQSGLSKFERGRQHRLGPVPLTRIAKVLGITFDQLVSGTTYQKDADSSNGEEVA